MNATRTRSTSSKKSARKGSRSTGGARGAKRARGSTGKSAGTKSAKRTRAAGKTAARGKSSARAGGKRAGGTPIAQAIELLTEDHRKVQKMFKQAERVKEDTARLRPIVEEACAALTEHTRIEEEYFYPVLQESIKDTDLIAEAYVEHASAKQLIGELQRGKGQGEEYAAKFTVLGEYVNHHIKEEQDEIFPKARRSRGDFQPLLDALIAKEAGTVQKGARAQRGATRGAQAGEAEAMPERRTARGRQGRGRSGAEATTTEAHGGAGTEQVESDVEQPRRGRRGAAEETGETESTGRGREQESTEQEERGSREAGR